MTQEKEGKKCICCLIAGIALLVVGIFADYIGLGKSMGFGYKQILAVVIGFILLILGTRPCKCGDFCKIGKDK